MKPISFNSIPADLLTPPASIATSEAGASSVRISTGDLHGNAMKLIYILIQQGILSLAARDDYNELFRIYRKGVNSLTQDDIEKYRDIIEQATIDKTRSLTIIGDELADRGNNDYYTLVVLKKLHESGLPFDIMISNHSFEFLNDFYASHGNMFGQHNLVGAQALSLVNLSSLIKKSQSEGYDIDIPDMVSSAYLPHLKAISYSVSPDLESITLYSHAPVGFETIKALAKEYKVTYNDSTILDLTETIDAINTEFHKRLAMGDMYARSNPKEYVSNDTPLKYPLYRLIWNRSRNQIDVRPQCLGRKDSLPYDVRFVHGHIGAQALLSLSSHINLDNELGKDNSLASLKSPYSITSCSETSKDVLQQRIEDKRRHDLLTVIEREKEELLGKAKVYQAHLISTQHLGNNLYQQKYDCICAAIDCIDKKMVNSEGWRKAKADFYKEILSHKDLLLTRRTAEEPNIIKRFMLWLTQKARTDGFFFMRSVNANEHQQEVQQAAAASSDGDKQQDGISVRGPGASQ